tara:strand:+ start:12496 stop:12999 length:504 start_codon:yes stop_codon:yes gene_type:complete
MTTLNTIEDINNEIIRITNTIHEKNIDYNFELQSLTNSNNTLMSYIAEYEKIKTKINSIQYSINTNSQGVINNMSMLSILKNLNTELKKYEHTIENRKNFTNYIEHNVYQINLEIQSYNDYLNELDKMKYRLKRWENYDKLTEKEKIMEQYKNEFKFNQQILALNSV